MASASEFADALAGHKPGDKISVTFTGNAGQRTATITVVENPALQTVTFEEAGRTPSADQIAFRNRWLASKAK